MPQKSKKISVAENGHDVCGTRRLPAIANALEASMDYIPAHNLIFNRLKQKSEPFKELIGGIARMDAVWQKQVLRYICFVLQEDASPEDASQ